MWCGFIASHSVIVNATATQHTCSLSGVRILVTSTVKCHHCSHVSSSFQSILLGSQVTWISYKLPVTLTMAGLFPNTVKIRFNKKLSFVPSMYFFKDLIYLLLEEKGGTRRGRETLMWERNINWLPLVVPWLGLNPISGVCPDRELNRRPFTLWDNSQPTDPHWSGLQHSHYWQGGSVCPAESMMLTRYCCHWSSSSFRT